ncbi:MAG: MopE-related protein [Pseudomonadota bacterium]
MDAAPLLLAALLMGCPSGHDPWDLDGDGYDENVDCNDHNDDVHPGAEEACNGRDDDCDGEVDEGAATSTWYRDSDGDGWGTEDDTVISCLTPSGYLLVGGDCDDGDRDIHPEATDMACDGIDQDCDGEEADCRGLTDLPTWSSTVARDCTGRSVAGPGDVDGDGYDDLLVGAAGCTGASAGRAWLVHGEPSPVDATMTEVGIEFTGVSSYGIAGWTVAGAGDANVDGLADLLVGAPGIYSGAPSAGAVYLLFGGAALAGGSLEAADGIIHGIERSGSLGVGLAGGGDLNGDGLDDVLLGASDADTAADNGGAVYLFLGPLAPGERGVDAADARLLGTAAYGEAGSSLAFVGDTDGDGLDDALIGAVRGHTAYLVCGRAALPDLTLDATDAIFLGPAGSSAGGSVGTAGDVDGDGLPDLLIGADTDDSAAAGAGAAYLVLGAHNLASRDLEDADAIFLGQQADDHAGCAVAGPGDLDGDGFADMAIGAWGAEGLTRFTGVVHLVRGGASIAGGTGIVSDVVLSGVNRDDLAGYALAALGDLDADGLPDLAVGAMLDDTSANDGGAVYLALGSALW